MHSVFRLLRMLCAAVCLFAAFMLAAPASQASVLNSALGSLSFNVQQVKGFGGGFARKGGFGMNFGGNGKTAPAAPGAAKAAPGANNPKTAAAGNAAKRAGLLGFLGGLGLMGMMMLGFGVLGGGFLIYVLAAMLIPLIISMIRARQNQALNPQSSSTVSSELLKDDDKQHDRRMF